MRHVGWIFSVVCVGLFSLSAHGRESCAKLSDDYCDQLWETKHGNWVGDGQSLLYGYTESSGLTHAYRMDLETYLYALPEFKSLIQESGAVPVDILNEIDAKIDAVRKTLEQEKDSREWYEELEEQSEELARWIRKVFYALTYTRYPELRQKSQLEYTIFDRLKFSEVYQAIDNKFVELKYGYGPRWESVRKIFVEAKADLLAVIDALPIDRKTRLAWHDKVASAELSLPYSDPRLIEEVEGCSTTLNNAFYSPDFNRFTICAGMLNTGRSEANLYSTVTHELSHAIDPNQTSMDRYKQSDTHDITQMLYSGHRYECKEWSSILRDAYARLGRIDGIPRGTETLEQCLLPEKDALETFSTESVREAATNISKSWISDWAENNIFTKLISRKTTVNYKEIDNPYYRAPENFRTLNSGSMVFRTPLENRHPIPTLEIFMQHLQCSSENGKTVDYFSIPDEPSTIGRRKALFEDSIRRTQETIQNVFEKLLDYSGNESNYLIEYRLAKSSAENFADWLSFRAITRKLGRIPSTEDRQKFVVQTGADFCTPPGTVRKQPDFTAIEKTFSYESHADDRIRRLSIFTQEIRDLVECDPEENWPSFGDCTIQ